MYCFNAVFVTLGYRLWVERDLVRINVFQHVQKYKSVAHSSLYQDSADVKVVDNICQCLSDV